MAMREDWEGSGELVRVKEMIQKDVRLKASDFE